MTTAFDPIDLSGTPLRNRIAMAPMTRSRAYGPGLSPTASTAAYYAQRASAGLIVTEGIQPSPVGQGYPDTPGLHSAGQVAAWRAVTEAVHAEGGRIFAQLMHTGRIGHPSLLGDGLVPVGASPVAARGQVYTAAGPQDFVVPEPLDRGRHPAHRRGPRGRRPQRDRRRVRRRRGARRQRLPRAPVPRPQLQHPHRRVGRRRSGPDPGSPSNWSARWPTRSAPAARACGSPPATAFGDIARARAGRHLPRAAPGAGAGRPGLPARGGGPRPRAHGGAAQARSAASSSSTPVRQGRPSGPEELALIEDGTADMLSYGALFLANPDLPRPAGAPAARSTPPTGPRTTAATTTATPTTRRWTPKPRFSRSQAADPTPANRRPAAARAPPDRRPATAQARRRPSAGAVPTADTAVSAAAVTAKACAETCAPPPAASRLR